MPSKLYTCNQGFALSLVLWSICIVLVGFTAFMKGLNLDIRHATLEKITDRAHDLAETGIALGLARSSDAVYQIETSPTEATSISVAVQSEGAKLNIPTFIAIPYGKTVFKNLFRHWKLKREASNELLQFMDALGKADNSTPLVAINELKLYPEFRQLNEKKRDWAESLTSYSDGKLDLNEANADVIAALCDIPLRDAENFTRTRKRLTRNPGEKAFATLVEANTYLKLPQSKFDELEQYLSIQSPIKRITARAKTPQAKKTIRAIYNAQPLKLLSWEEGIF